MGVKGGTLNTPPPAARAPAPPQAPHVSPPPLGPLHTSPRAPPSLPAPPPSPLSPLPNIWRVRVVGTPATVYTKVGE